MFHLNVLVHLNRVPSCRDQISPAILIGPTDTADRAGRHMESMKHEHHAFLFGPDRHAGRRLVGVLRRLRSSDRRTCRQPYSNNILAEPSLVAYWPLSDFPNSPPPAGAPALPPPPQGSTGVGIAQDLSGNNHNGSYINPPIYQSGTTFLTTMGNPPVDLNPTLNLHQASIVPGDAFASGSKNLPACVDFEGGYVSIPWAANSPSLTDFTFEAWIKPRWTVTGFNWVVFAARTNNGTGFALFINAPKPMGVHHRKRHSTYGG